VNGTAPKINSEIIATYSVYYIANGADSGIVPTDNTDYIRADTVTVQGNLYSLVKRSYNFTGWNTQPDGNGLNFAQGETFIVGSSDIILYARWSAGITYSVSYSGNGAYTGVTPIDTTMYESEAGVLIPGNTGSLARPGYSFTGWNTLADGNGTTYTQGQYMTMGGSNVILYAEWTTNTTYTIIYNANNADTGTVPVDSTSYETGKSVIAMGNTGNLKRAGYSFTGWNTQPDGSGITCLQGQTFTMGTENVILYAKWTLGYSVTYNSNGADSGPVPVDALFYPQNSIVNVQGNTGSLVRSGYSFAGWNTRFDGSGATYTQGQSFPMGSSNVTLYAIWKLNPGYSVTYFGNGSTGGDVPVDNTSYIYGQTVVAAENSGLLEKTGYVFLGWNTEADWSGTSYTAGESFTMGASNVELYAMWGGSGSVDISFKPGTGVDSGISSVAVQPDGDIIIVGDFTTYNEVPRNCIARLNSNGSLDTAFDPGTGANNTIYAVVIQADGRIIIAGDFTAYNGVSRNHIARLNSDGSLDESFDPGTGADGPIYCVAVQSDGLLLIGGEFTNYNDTACNYIARVNSDGSLDVGFDTTYAPDNIVYAIAVQPDDRIIIAGSFSNCGFETRNRIARLENSGVLDITFDPGAGASGDIYSAVLQPDNKVVLGGEFSSYLGSEDYIARANEDGSHDTEFLSSGTGPDLEVFCIAIQSDGKILIGGNFENYNNTSCMYLARLNPDGTLDAGFRTNNGPDGAISCIAIQPDGRIIIGGVFSTYNGISRKGITRVLE